MIFRRGSKENATTPGSHGAPRPTAGLFGPVRRRRAMTTLEVDRSATATLWRHEPKLVSIDMVQLFVCFCKEDSLLKVASF